MIPSAESSFSPLDRHFARLMCELADKPSEELRLASSLVSFHGNNGHVCLPLEKVAGCNGPLENFPSEVSWTPPLEPWVKKLRGTRVVGAPGDFTPLILDHHNRLYLRRYWEYETTLAKNILTRIKTSTDFDPALLRERLDRLFPKENDEINWQKLAAFAAVTNNFCVISGGPGTGKTRIVVIILALLLEQAKGRNLRITLCAPTG